MPEETQIVKLLLVSTTDGRSRFFLDGVFDFGEAESPFVFVHYTNERQAMFIAGNICMILPTALPIDALKLSQRKSLEIAGWCSC